MTDIAAEVVSSVGQAVGIPAEDLTNVPAIPSFLTILTHDFAQKVFTGFSVWLLSKGFDHITSQASIVQFGVGATGLVLSCAWTLGAGYLRKQKMTDLFNFIPKDK